MDEDETTARLLVSYPEEGTSGIMPATRPRAFLRSGLYLAAGMRSYALRASNVLIGRSPHCRVVLDDRRVSHEHAALVITAHDVVLEDVGSVNGTWLNGLRVDEPQALREGDVIVVGAQELHVAPLPDTAPRAPEGARARTARTMESEPAETPAERSGSLAMLGRAAGRKLAEGDKAGAEAVLRDALMMVLVSSYSGQPLPNDVCTAASKQALTLAMALGAPRWINYVFELHLRVGLPNAAEVPRLLTEAVSAVRGLDHRLAAEYLELLEETGAGGEERWLAIVLRSLLR